VYRWNLFLCIKATEGGVVTNPATKYFNNLAGSIFLFNR
jgi:hypothetical protein